jgi:hypothetical protein
LAATFSDLSGAIGKADVDGVAEFTNVGTSSVSDLSPGGVGVDIVVN